MSYIPDRGDLVWVDFDPTKGREQKGHRPALIISPKHYHKVSDLSLVCPITSNQKKWPWKVLLPKNYTVTGSIIVDQLKSIDIKARKLQFIAKLDRDILDEVLAKVETLIE